MSHPESQQSLGYFPCPTEVIDRVCKAIKPHPEMVVCDPCAGKGVAIAHLGERLAVAPERIIAAELDVHRSQRLIEKLPGSRVTGSVDFLSAVYYSNSVSLMYLNPPYDKELGYAERLESTFLSRATGALVPGGILVYVVPRQRIRVGGLRLMLHNLYEQIESFDFPPKLRKYDECVVIAYKRRRPTSDKFTDPNFLKAARQESIFQAKPGAPFTFRKQQYTEQELLRLLDFNRAVESLIGNRRDAKRLRPPLELGDGHKALLLAAGYLNGRIAKPGRPPHVVRGTCRKVDRLKDESREGKYKTQVIEERIELLIRKVDATGTIEDIVDAEPAASA